MSNPLVHSFTVNQVDVEYDVICRMNVKKRVEQFVFRSVLPDDSFAISYARGITTSPLYNLYVSDKSDALTQNRDDDTIQTGTVGFITDSTSKLFITDVFVAESATQPETPLFLVHRLANFNDDLTGFSSLSLVSLGFLDEDLIPLDVDEYFTDITTGMVYNNFENEHNPLTGVYGATFVQYAVKDGGTVTTYRELISNTRVFDEATWDHLTPLGTLDPAFKRYILTTAATGNAYKYTFAGVNRFAWKRGRRATLSVLPVGDTGMEFPWYLQVNRSEIQAPQKGSAGLFLNYKYHIAEYMQQAFSPYPPYRFVNYESISVLSSRLLKLHHGVVVDGPKSLYTLITFLDITGTIVGYASNDPSLAETTGTDGLYYQEITSVDQRDGFVELKTDVGTTVEEARADYYTLDEYYDFTEFNFNPVSNLASLSQKIVLYVAPESLSTGTLANSLHHLVVDDLGRVTYCSQADSPSAPYDSATSKLVSEDFDTDGVVSHHFDYDYPSTTPGLLSRASGVGDPDDFSFKDKYTVDSVLFDDVLVSGVSLSGTLLENYNENARFLVLGEVQIGPAVAADNLFLYDTRLNGGGIMESRLDLAIDQQPEAIWYADVAQANTYPGMGAFMVHVPHKVLSEYGGNFTRDQVTAVFEKHMAAGGYGVIRSYGLDPVYTGLVGWSGTVQLRWPSYDSALQYRTGWSTDQKVWNYDQQFDIGPPGPNSKTWSGLSLNQQHYFSLEAWNTDDEIWEPGEVVKHRVGVNPISQPVVLGT